MMTICKATSLDLPSLSALFDEYRVFYECDSDLPGTNLFIFDRIKNNDSEIFVSKSGSNVVTGFVQLYPLFSSIKMVRLWLLNDLYVSPAFRGLKISINLIERAKQLARETNSAGLLLETAKSNTIGNNLYLKTNFVLDRDHNYYSWNEDTKTL